MQTVVTELTEFHRPMLFVALVIAGFLGWAIWHQQRDPGSRFDLLDLVMESGRLSKAAVVMMGSFVVTTWMMFDLTIQGKMTETYFLQYGGLWIVPVIAKIWKGDGKVPEQAEAKP